MINQSVFEISINVRNVAGELAAGRVLGLAAAPGAPATPVRK
ncbi:hypothetical protein [Streptomyces sp. yr375]|nr:hypothetical protein [Streptomyces sp. yr375]